MLERVKVKIGGRVYEVPIFEDKDHTLTLAKDLNKRLETIEQKSDRIDTQAFTVEAAMELMSELYEAASDLKDQEREYLSELDTLDTEISRLIKHLNIKPKERS
jgi:cell division protein ZapA (FtsZ GTPase activity inhibitor)